MVNQGPASDERSEELKGGTETPRFSQQIRVDHPEPIERPDPRAIQLAIKVCELEARGHGVSIRDLMLTGFSATELFEHHATANQILRGDRL